MVGGGRWVVSCGHSGTCRIWNGIARICTFKSSSSFPQKKKKVFTDCTYEAYLLELGI